jgi:ABC-2 type transport system permease protein
MTTIHSPAVPTGASHAGAFRVTGARVVAAEWIKFRSTRSAWWIVVATVLSLVAAGISPALTVLLGGPTTEDVGADPTGGALAGVSFTQVLVGALGALFVTGEYATGLVRSSLVAVPRRLPVLWAKLLVVTAVVLGASLVSVVVAYVTAQAVLASAGIAVPSVGPDVLRALAGAALYLALTAALGAGFGWLLRSTAGALTGLFAFLFVLPLLGLVLPQITAYLPNNAGAAVLQVGPAAGALPPWIGLGIYAAYAAVVLTAAASLLRRRDV